MERSILDTALEVGTDNVNQPGKVYSFPEYTEFPHAFFATRILKYQLRLAPQNRFVKNMNCFN
jgi:hypothetical protein